MPDNLNYLGRWCGLSVPTRQTVCTHGGNGRFSHINPRVDQDGYNPCQCISCSPYGLHRLFSRTVDRFKYPTLIYQIISFPFDEQIPGGVPVLISTSDEIGNVIVLMEDETPCIERMGRFFISKKGKFPHVGGE